MKKDTICALATASGMGAIAIIRVSGENTKKIMSLDKKYKSPNMNIREVGKVKQRVNSIEKKRRNPDFRNVRLNSWTNEGKKTSRDFN